MFSLQVILKQKTASAFFTWNLEETCKSRAKPTVLKGHLSPNSVIFINSSSAIPLLLEAACLQSHAIDRFFCLPPASLAVGRTKALPQGLKQDCSQPLCSWFSALPGASKGFCLRARDSSFKRGLFCLLSRISRYHKLCVSPASGHRVALVAIWPLMNFFP